MTNKEAIAVLESVRDILDKVYVNFQGNDRIREAMSVADCAIYDALVVVEKDIQNGA